MRYAILTPWPRGCRVVAAGHAAQAAAAAATVGAALGVEAEDGRHFFPVLLLDLHGTALQR